MSYQSEPWTLSDSELTPLNNKSSKRNRGIPDNFKEEYMRYVKGEIAVEDLQHKFGIAESTVRRWRNLLGLPRKKANIGEIPDNFKEEYMRYIRGDMTMKDLRRKFNIGESTVHRWQTKLGLPKKSMIRYKVSRNFKGCFASEPVPSANGTPYLEDSFITLCVFGYQFSIKNPFVFKKIK